MKRRHGAVWGLTGLLALVMGQECYVNAPFFIDDLDVNWPGKANWDDSQGPVFTVAPVDLTLDCDAVDQDLIENWLNSARAGAGDSCGPVKIEHDFGQLTDTCNNGSWVVHVAWTARDRCGRSTRHQARLTLTDPAPPVITLVGDDEVIVPLGIGTYTERGAIARFGCGLAEAPAEIGGDTVNKNVAGIYTVRYTFADPCGQQADEVTRVVHVVPPPQFTVTPADYEVACGDGAAGTIDAWLDSAAAEADPACGEITLSHEFVGLDDTCTEDAWTLQVRWIAEDECGLSSSVTAALSLTGEGEPSIALIGDESLTLECHQGIWEDPGAVVTFACAGISVPATIDGEADPGVPGTYTITYALTDDCDHATQTLTRVVEVVDTQGPEVIVRDDLELWPPDHKYVTLDLADCVEQAEDACAGELDLSEAGQILSIVSNEPDNATGDGNTTNDTVIVDNDTFKVRAERRGNGSGRVYTVNFEVADEAGNTTEHECRIVVPHDQSGQDGDDDDKDNDDDGGEDDDD